MDFPPKKLSDYIFKEEQDVRIFEKLKSLAKSANSPEKTGAVNFLVSQLESNWRQPLEDCVDMLLNR